MAVLVLLTQKGCLWGKLANKEESRGWRPGVRSPCCAADSEWGPWALRHSWAGPAWLSERPWLEVTGETRIMKLNAAGLLGAVEPDVCLLF